MTTTNYLLTKDNIKLFYELNTITDSFGIVVIVHGLSEHHGRYKNIVKCLNDNKYSTLAFDNRGNGLSEGAKGDLTDYNLFLTDLNLMKELALTISPNVFLLGHSLGGFIVNAYGAKYNDVKGIISSGAVGVFLPQVTIFRFLPFKPFGHIMVKNKLSDVLSHDKEVGIAYSKDPYVNKYNRLRLMGNCFIKGVRYVRKNIKNLTVPILYLHGENDQIVPNESSKYLYSRVGSSDKKIIIYDDMYHEIMNEVDKDIVFKDIIEWLNAHE